jgi:thiol:disulfide interchange protein DsbA
MRRFLLALAILPAFALAQALPAPTAGGTPQPGVDYEVLPLPAPTYGHGGIEVAEVFSYACIHCAHFQPYVTAWKKKLPKDVRWEYVPADFGGVWSTFARAYFAADQMHVLDKTHEAVFKAVHEDHAISSGTPDEVAAMYGSLGVDPTRFLAAMTNPATEQRLAQAHQFALSTGIEGTPTIVIDGRYRVTATGGFDRMLATTDYLIAVERAAIKKAGTPASSKKP